jgi:hypothetical protein
MDSTHLDIQEVRKHLENIERELAMLILDFRFSILKSQM